jgi:hypothetical protein
VKKNQVTREHIDLSLSKRELSLICHCIDEAWNRLSESELHAIMGVNHPYLEEMIDYILETLKEMNDM